MRILQRALVCILCLASSLAAQNRRVDSARVNRVIRDSTGQIWGAGIAASPSLFRWSEDEWDRVPMDGIADTSRPRTLAAGPDGAVYCLWSDNDGRYIVTWHRGAVSRKLAEFSGDMARVPNLFVDPKLNIWITDRGIHIYRVTPGGKPECAYTLDYDQRWSANRPQGTYINFESVYATAAGQDRVWFWSGGPGGGGVSTLKGILIFDGRNFTLHSNLPGPPVTSYATVFNEDADHMLLAAARDRLYRVDTRTLTAQPVAEPTPGAFRDVQSIFRVGDALYLVAVNGLQPVPERSGEGRFGVLWRRQGGHWSRVMVGIDMRPAMLLDPLRSFVNTPQGMWLGAYGAGPWFIPAGSGEPEHIDWRYGFPLPGGESLLPLPHDRLLVVAAATGSMAVTAADLLAAPHPAPGVRTLNPLRVMVQDSRNHIWGLLSGDTVLSEWDGKIWTDHAMPSSFNPLEVWNLGVDSNDRIWLLADPCQGEVSIFNPHDGNVASFADFSAALQAQLPGRAAFHLQGNHFPVAAFAAGGRIAYLDPCQRAHFFNGQTWQVWWAREIDRGQRRAFEGPAFFDQTGNFAVNISGQTWEYTPAEQWRTTAFDRGLGTDRERTPFPGTAPLVPSGCSVDHPQSATEDRLGTTWLTYQGLLYRAVPGACVAQFSPHELQPFIDSRTIRHALIDPQGNAFLETEFKGPPGVGEYVILNARPPVPRTVLSAQVKESGVVDLHFQTQVKDHAAFRWKVDGGGWAAPTEGPEASLNWLPAGRHIIQAIALDGRLQADPTPAAAEVTVHVDSQQQLATLIEQLKDPDYSRRNAAVAALARQTGLALPALKAARAKAGPDQRWWIDAAIQQIEEKRTEAGKP